MLLFTLLGVAAGAGTCLMNGYVSQLPLSKASMTLVTIDIDMQDDQVQLVADLPIYMKTAYVVVEAYAAVGAFPTLPDGSPDVSKGTGACDWLSLFCVCMRLIGCYCFCLRVLDDVTQRNATKQRYAPTATF